MVDVEGHGAESGDGVEQEEGVGTLDDFADGADVVGGAGGGFRRLQHHGAGGGIGGEGFGDAVGGDGIAIGGGEDDGIEAEDFGEGDPTLTEFAGRADDDAVAGGEEIGDGGLKCAGAGGDDAEDVVGGAEDALQGGKDATVELAEILGAVVDVGRPSSLGGPGAGAAWGPE